MAKNKKDNNLVVRDNLQGKLLEPIPMSFEKALKKALNTPLPKKEKKKKN